MRDRGDGNQKASGGCVCVCVRRDQSGTSSGSGGGGGGEASPAVSCQSFMTQPGEGKAR